MFFYKPAENRAVYSSVSDLFKLLCRVGEEPYPLRERAYTVIYRNEYRRKPVVLQRYEIVGKIREIFDIVISRKPGIVIVDDIVCCLLLHERRLRLVGNL